MKNAFFLFCTVAIVSCNNQTNVKEVNTITGKYVTERQFPVETMNNNVTLTGIFRDTVEIKRGEGEYTLIQSGTRFVPEPGGDTSRKRKVQPTVPAKYDERSKTLVSFRTTISFLEGGNQLYLGMDTAYKYSRID